MSALDLCMHAHTHACIHTYTYTCTGRHPHAFKPTFTIYTHANKKGYPDMKKLAPHRLEKDSCPQLEGGNKGLPCSVSLLEPHPQEASGFTPLLCLKMNPHPTRASQ